MSHDHCLVGEDPFPAVIVTFRPPTRFTLIAVQEPGTYKCPYNLGQTLSRAGATIS